MKLLRHGSKEAVKFVTPSGVTAVVATSVSADLMRDLARKLERKLKRGISTIKSNSKRKR